MAFLAVDPREIDLNARYVVDVKNRSMKAVPRVSRARR